MSRRNLKFYKGPDRTAVTLLIVIAVIMGSLLIINILKGKGSDISGSPSLEFLISGEVIKDMDLGELKENLDTQKISFYDPNYKKEKRYQGFALVDVLELGFGEQWKSYNYTDVTFEALDGYTAVSSTSKLTEPGGYIVFEDLDFKDWEPVSIKQADPGPYYLVWTGKDQTAANGYPWPWELSSMNLVKFEDQYSAVFPSGVSVGSSVYKGYQIFKGRCIRCHAMNGEGGKIAPDLNAPQSIVSYRNTYMIKEFIKNPSKYRYTQMPDHPDLSEQNLDNLISYFKYMDEIRN